MDTHGGKILVLGIGGAGICIINGMTGEQSGTLEFVGIDTDENALKLCTASKRLRIGRKLPERAGTDMDPETGRRAAEESAQELGTVLEGADVLLLVYGMGGGTGAGAAPVVARLAREKGIFVFTFAITPFCSEKRTRTVNVQNEIALIHDNTDGLTLIPNNMAFQNAGRDAPVRELPEGLNRAVRQRIQAIANLFLLPSLINLDVADLKNVVKEKGITYIGRGESSGSNKVQAAVRNAMQSSWQDAGFDAKKPFLVNMAGNFDISDLAEGWKYIKTHIPVGDNTEVVFGASYIEESDNLVATIIGTEAAEPAEYF